MVSLKHDYFQRSAATHIEKTDPRMDEVGLYQKYIKMWETLAAICTIPSRHHHQLMDACHKPFPAMGVLHGSQGF